MSDKVAWGVFKGLFGFFILLPIGVCIAFAIVAGSLTLFETGKEEAQGNASMAASNAVFTANNARQAELENKRHHEEVANQSSLKQAALDQEEGLRIEKQKKAEALFEYRRQRAINGYPSACYDLGLMFLSGEGTQTNVDLGMKWIRIELVPKAPML